MSLSNRLFLLLAGIGLMGCGSLIVAQGSSPLSTWSAASSGYVHDTATRSLRPINGFVGAAYLGAGVVAGLDWAGASPDQRSAFIVKDGLLLWIPDLRVPDRAETLPENIPVPSEGIWAQDATRIAFLSPNRIVWLLRNDGSPSVEASWELGGEGASWRLLAVDAGARRALLAVQAGDVSQLWLTSPTEPPVLIGSGSRFVAAVFRSQAEEAWIADAATRQILRANLAAQTELAPWIALETEPGSLVLSVDGSRLFVASVDQRSLQVRSTADGSLETEIGLNMAPRGVRLIAPGRYLLVGRETPSEPLYVLDATDRGQVFFVPGGE